LILITAHMEANVVFVARMGFKMAIKTKPRLIVMDQDCDIILNRIRSRMRSTFVRSAIKHYQRWQEHGSAEFNDIRLDKYGTRDVNLRISNLEDQLYQWQDRVGEKNLKIKELENDIEILTSRIAKRWWKFW